MKFAALAKKQHSFWLAKLGDPSFVYIIGSTHDRPFKVGVAKDVLARGAILQTGNPYELRVIQVAPGDVRLEHEFHDVLRRYRMHGEWFEATMFDKFCTIFRKIERAMAESWVPGDGSLPDYTAHTGPWPRPAPEQGPFSSVRYVEPTVTPEEAERRRREYLLKGRRMAA